MSLTPEQIAERRQGIGASDAPAVLGLSPWRTPLEVFLEKTGRAAAQEETLAMRVGRALEPVVLRQFAEETGLSVAREQERIVCPRWPWRWVTVDAIASDGALIEAKTTSSIEGWGEQGSDQIPLHYVVQVQHGLACSGAALAYVPVLFAAREFRLYEIRRDEELIEAITARECEFWRRVEANEPPPVSAGSDLRLRYQVDNGASVVADEPIAAAVAELRTLRGRIGEYEAQVEALKTQVMAYMAEAATLLDADGRALATWKAAKASARFDASAFKAAHSSLYSEFSRPGAPQRRFLVKG